MTSKKTYTNPDTILAVAGRDPANNFGIVNPPVYHASTILSPTMDKFENRIPFEGFGYGRNGTPTQKAPGASMASIRPSGPRALALSPGARIFTPWWCELFTGNSSPPTSAASRVPASMVTG